MFIKLRVLAILAIVLLFIMIAEWKFVARITKGSVLHSYNGHLNGGVGRPYADFIHQLRAFYENGDTNNLARALQQADERSRDIYDVWLVQDGEAYRKSIHEILK